MNTVTDVEWEKNGEDIKYNEVDSVQELEEKKQAHNTFSIENSFKTFQLIEGDD